MLTSVPRKDRTPSTLLKDADPGSKASRKNRDPKTNGKTLLSQSVKSRLRKSKSLIMLKRQWVSRSPNLQNQRRKNKNRKKCKPKAKTRQLRTQPIPRDSKNPKRCKLSDWFIDCVTCLYFHKSGGIERTNQLMSTIINELYHLKKQTND